MKTIFLGTTNQGKIREFSQKLKPLKIKIISPISLNIHIDPEENGDTFEDNAMAKAQAWVAASHFPVLVDDSGLCIDALNGDPGVRSKRFFRGSDEDRNMHVLKLMKKFPEDERTAYYICALAFIDPHKHIQKMTTGRLNGTIGYVPIGTHGFGYDPIFIPEGYAKTVAELGEEVKNTISHRAQALDMMIEFLQQWVLL